jgi:hypothetical protein
MKDVSVIADCMQSGHEVAITEITNEFFMYAHELSHVAKYLYMIH